MALDLLFQEQIAGIAIDERYSSSSPSEKWKTTFDNEREQDENLSGGFDCNICLDVVKDPVVTFCGHLYCWPCIYKWIQFQTISSEQDPDHRKPQSCPVCKAQVSHKTLIPLYGPGQATTTTKKPSEDDDVPSKDTTVIPQRPPRPTCVDQTLMSSTTTTTTNQLHHRSNSGVYMALPVPVIGELVYARVFGNAYPHSYNLSGNDTSLRTRRQLLHADRSLGRLYFFLLCCVLACLLLF